MRKSSACVWSRHAQASSSQKRAWACRASTMWQRSKLGWYVMRDLLFSAKRASSVCEGSFLLRYSLVADLAHSVKLLVTGYDSARLRGLIAVSPTASIEKITRTAATSLMDARDLPNASAPRPTPPTLLRSIVRSSSPPIGGGNDRGHHPLRRMMPPSVPQAARLRFAHRPIIFLVSSSDARAQSCACPPIYCSVVPSPSTTRCAL
jgi:hypothetical protein